MFAALDGFVLVTIAGLVVLHLLPEGVRLGGWLAVAATFLGALLPGRIHHLGAHEGGRASPLLLWLALAGLGGHAAMDGMALVTGLAQNDADRVLAAAVVLHRFPVGIAIWWLVRPAYGPRAALLVIAVVAVGTLVGWFAGDVVLTGLSGPLLGSFQCLVAGSVLHVILHHPAVPGLADPDRAARRASGAGGIAGLVLLVLLDQLHDDGPGMAAVTTTSTRAGIALVAALAGGLLLLAARRHLLDQEARPRIDLGGALAASLLAGPLAGGLALLVLGARSFLGPRHGGTPPLGGTALALVRRQAPGLLVALAVTPPLVAIADHLALERAPLALLLPATALAAWLLPLGGAGWALVTAGLVSHGLPAAAIVAAVVAGSDGPASRGRPRSWLLPVLGTAAALLVGANPATPLLGAPPLAAGAAAGTVVVLIGLAVLLAQGTRAFLAPLLEGGSHHPHQHPD